MSRALFFALVPLLLSAATPEQIEFFEARIRPVLAQNCYECHSEAGKAKGGLKLDSRPGWQAGGDTGPTIIAGKASESLLIATIKHEHADMKMPKDGAKLDDHVIVDFERWINEGAPDPRDAPPSKDELAKATAWPAVLAARKQWWSLLPLKDEGRRMKDETNIVDAYIDERLKAEGIEPAPDADPATLAKRMSYVLTGLPGEIGSVEEMMASPKFGEKWARHWLDWVRYAESYGSEGDAIIPYAWRYRDYVVRAFNANVPYPQLLREAIAGDLLPQPRIVDGINESALGIGQLRMVLHGFSPVDSLDEMVTFTDNQIDTITKAFQGMTVSCARCHNHKFDAISQTDFYALYGIFTSTHPAIINVSAADDRAQREQMRELKQQLQQVLAQAWIGQISPIGPISERAPGDFAIATEGQRIIEHIHTSGWHSDSLSTKDPLVMNGPTFKNEGGTLWLRARGAGGARVRYVVQNYPRTGTVHKAKDFKTDGDTQLRWHPLQLDYWKGDEIFVQATTAADMPAEAKLDERSWVELSEWRILPNDSPAPESPKPSGDSRTAIEAWLAGKATAAHAELLDHLISTGKLINDPRKVPGAGPLLAKYRALENRLPMPVRAPGVMEGTPTDRALFVRGDHKQPSDIVKRRFLEAIDPAPYQTKGSGRLELANSIADMKRNPLTARVIVNRLWHHVFGRGLVSTTDNFGRLGEKPTHPELLDALAKRFIDSGGDIKDMIRTLVYTKVFQRSDTPTASAKAKDPENKLLSHWSTRRLDAEAIRDSLIHLSGKLDTKLGGESVSGSEERRSIYVKVIRNSLDPFLNAFDAPTPTSTRGKRDATNVPAQSLTLLNDPNVQSWARDWALRSATTQDSAVRVKQLFAEAYQRPATSEEVASSLAYIESVQASTQQQRSELTALESQAEEVQQQIEAVLAPARAKLIKPSEKQPLDLPKPDAEWTFDVDARDTQGKLDMQLFGSARIDHGALILDGTTARATTAPLTTVTRQKTLEAWVQLSRLDQQGGGVLTMQDTDGGVFDAIVFGEKQPKTWVPGSNNFTRSQLLTGPTETEADKRPVHVAIVYEQEGRITFYRDGVPYGQTYATDGPAVFKPMESELQLGCRHGHGGGNKMLSGEIHRARFYRRALSAEEIARSSLAEEGSITQAQVLATLDAATREKLTAQQGQLTNLQSRARDFRDEIARSGDEQRGWVSLALALVNAKEFIYLR